MADYLLIAGPETAAEYGQPVPEGAAFGRVIWDGVTEWTPPFGATAVPDDGRPIWQPAQ